MRELRDYSGEFDPSLKLEDFSKEFLVKLMQQWAYAYLRMDEIWTDVIRGKLSKEETIKCELEAWGKVAEATLPRIAEAMNIQPKTILDVMKIWQILPDGVGTGLYDATYEIKNENHILWILDRCRTLEFLEKNGNTERLVEACQVLDPFVLEKYLKVFLPDAEVKPLKLPTGPREDPTEKPACIWEFKLKS